MQTPQTNYQTAAGAVSRMAPVTVIHFVAIALLALLAVAIIIVGARLARRRHRAEDEVIEHQHEAAALSAAAPAAAPENEPGAVPEQPGGVAAWPTDTPSSPVERPGDLTRLKGLGPRIATRLGEFGVYSIADMAKLTPEAARTLDAELTPFQGRLSRDRWVDQAKLLAAGDTEAYERAFGKLG